VAVVGHTFLATAVRRCATAIGKPAGASDAVSDWLMPGIGVYPFRCEIDFLYYIVRFNFRPNFVYMKLARSTASSAFGLAHVGQPNGDGMRE
jgi:hypothetical protein